MFPHILFLLSAFADITKQKLLKHKLEICTYDFFYLLLHISSDLISRRYHFLSKFESLSIRANLARMIFEHKILAFIIIISSHIFQFSAHLISYFQLLSESLQATEICKLCNLTLRQIPQFPYLQHVEGNCPQSPSLALYLYISANISFTYLSRYESAS